MHGSNHVPIDLIHPGLQKASGYVVEDVGRVASSKRGGVFAGGRTSWWRKNRMSPANSNESSSFKSYLLFQSGFSGLKKLKLKILKLTTNTLL